MVHVAMFDAINSIERRYRPYLVQLPASRRHRRKPRLPTAAGTVLSGASSAGRRRSSRTPWRPISRPSRTAPRRRPASSLAKQSPRRCSRHAPNDGAHAAGHLSAEDAARRLCPDASPWAPTWPRVKPFALTSGGAVPAGAADRAHQRGVGDRLQRDQGARRRDSTKRSARQTEDARFWLAAGRVIYYPLVRQLAAGQEHEVARQRSLDGAHRRSPVPTP